jgi:hypothetical protein
MIFWKLFFENQKVGAHIEEVVVIGFFSFLYMSANFLVFKKLTF